MFGRPQLLLDVSYKSLHVEGKSPLISDLNPFGSRQSAASQMSIVSHRAEAIDNKNHFAGGRRIVYMEALIAISTLPPGVSVALKLFFSVLEMLVIAAGIYVFRSREKLFAYKAKEGDTYASANLRLAMVVLIWVHAVIFTGIMIFQV